MKVRFLLLLLLGIIGPLPVSAYWQQEVNYEIDVKLDDQNHQLRGNINIEYINNSPDTLYKIFMHLWPNAYRNNQTALAQQKLKHQSKKFYFSNPEQRGYIDSLDFKINGQYTQWRLLNDHIDIAKIPLSQPLFPGDTITLSTDFLVKIPYPFSRLGHKGQSYQISQWYPKPAVYDQKGWHPMPYLDQGEFYSEYGTFDVSITLPKNYVVGATGQLQNERERKWLNQKARQTAQKSSFNKNDMDFPPSSTEQKTLHYHAENVHDFAWFADKRYNVLKGKVQLPNSDSTVTTWALFTNDQANMWKHSVEYLNSTIKNYSKWVGNYPYPHATAVTGALSAGGGMEYPMITVIGHVQSGVSLERVIVHELGHNWFYGILGFNERQHPWMDEGINSFYEKRHMRKQEQQEGDTSSVANNLANFVGKEELDQRKILYQLQAHRHREQPSGSHSTTFSALNYGVMVYMKVPLYLEYMEAYLGRSDFDNTMQEFYDKWKFKHPGPQDFRHTFQQTGKEMSWFFDHMLSTTWKLDYAITNLADDTVNIRNKGDNSQQSVYYELTIKNKGGIKGPYSISAIKDGEVVNTIWYGGFPDKMKVLYPKGDYDAFTIDAQHNMPEINRKNNTIKTKGLFKKTEPLRLQPLLALHNGDRTELTYAPIMGWNNYDKTMLGIAFYNSLLYPQNFEYLVAPMYSFSSNSVTGFGRLAYNWYTDHSSLFEYIRFEVAGRTFSEEYYSITSDDDPNFFERKNLKYYKVSPSITFNFQSSTPTSSVQRKLKVRNIQIYKNQTHCAQTNNVDKVCEVPVSRQSYKVNELSYEEEHDRAINPFKFNINVQHSKNFVKTFGEGKYTVTYNENGKNLEMRLFGGSFLYNNDNYPDARFRLSGWNGQQDYLYDHLYFDRQINDPILSRQIAPSDGAFKTNSSIGQTDQWLVSLNLESHLPFTKLVKVFADVGTFHGAGTSLHPNSEKIAYNTGVILTPGTDYMEVYIPALMSEGIQGDAKFYERITFTLQLHKLDIFKIVRNARISAFQ